MDKNINATVSTLDTYTCDKSTTYTKKIYLECSCGARSDLGRIIIEKEVEQDKMISNDVYIELPLDDPAGNYVCNQTFRTPIDRVSYPFKKLFRRMKLAFSILIFKKIYVTSDIILNFKSAREMADKLIEVLNEMEKNV